jgi:hypothetical protein
MVRWDAARALNPQDSLRQRIGPMEQKMLAEHPEFF